MVHGFGSVTPRGAAVRPTPARRVVASMVWRATVAIILAIHPASAFAQAIVDQWDAQLWLQWNSQIPVAETWGLVLEAQPRWNENFSHYDQVTLRAGLFKRVTPKLQLSAAYAFVPRHTVIGTVVEHQAYQQASVALPRIGHWTAQARVREEERYLGQWGELSHRVRERFHFTHPVPHVRGWTIVLHQELIINWNDTHLGPAAGLDQHRLFTGVNHVLTSALAVEAGYMWQDVFRLGPRPERHNHIAMVQFQFRPRRSGGELPPVTPMSSAAGGRAEE